MNDGVLLTSFQMIQSIINEDANLHIIEVHEDTHVLEEWKAQEAINGGPVRYTDQIMEKMKVLSANDRDERPDYIIGICQRQVVLVVRFQ